MKVEKWIYNESKHCGVDYSDIKQAARYDENHSRFGDYEKEVTYNISMNMKGFIFSILFIMGIVNVSFSMILPHHPTIGEYSKNNSCSFPNPMLQANHIPGIFSGKAYLISWQLRKQTV